MEIVRQANQNIIDFLGGAQIKKDGIKYRMNTCVMKVKYEDVNLLYNSMTGALISIRDIELEDIYTNEPRFYAQYMRETYFLVPENFEENKIIDEYRATHYVPITATYLNHLTSFTILTTTRCNARCGYCYQRPLKGKDHMTKETAEKVAQYIIDSTFQNEEITLDWFGGEPLFNKDVIDLIICRVEAAGRQFHSSMISNSYLFDEKTVEHAVKYWKLRNVQVTLDGTEEVYNKIKSYIYKDDPSPFKTVIKNMHTLIDNKIPIAVRLNVDENNMEDIEKLVNYLVEEFKGYENSYVNIYVWPIFEIGFTREPEVLEKLMNKLKEINVILFDHHFGHFTDDTNGIKFRHCMVDSGSNVVINPAGDIGLCEHHIKKHLIGHIDTPLEKDMSEITPWRKHVPYDEAVCNDCPMRAACMKVYNCPSYNICRAPEKDYILHRAELGIIHTYQMFLKNVNCNNGCNCCGVNNCMDCMDCMCNTNN